MQLRGRRVKNEDGRRAALSRPRLVVKDATLCVERGTRFFGDFHGRAGLFCHVFAFVQKICRRRGDGLVARGFKCREVSACLVRFGGDETSEPTPVCHEILSILALFLIGTGLDFFALLTTSYMNVVSS